MAEVHGGLSRAAGPTLTREGFAAHRVSAELQELARTNTPGRLKVAARADRRYRLDVALLVVLLGIGLVWVADNVVGYATSAKPPLVVTSEGTVRRMVHIPHGSAASADCWRSGGVQRVWKAAPPFSWLVPYRCGAGALAAGIPGMMSAGAALVVLFAAFLLRVAWRRRQKLAWY